MSHRSVPSKLKIFLKKQVVSFCQLLFLNRASDITNDLPCGPLLVIAPHPDDETLGCAGLMRRYRAQGHVVRIIVVTDGSQAKLPANPSPQEVAAMRRRESIRAANLLDIPTEEVLFLSYPDGAAQEHRERIAADIASQIWLYQPALILSPHGIDAHVDHRTVSTIVQALRKEGKVTCPVLEYPMWFWPKGALRHLFSKALKKTHRKVAAREYLAEKQQAIDAHVCQKSEENWDLLEAYSIAANLRDYELFFEMNA